MLIIRTLHLRTHMRTWAAKLVDWLACTCVRVRKNECTLRARANWSTTLRSRGRGPTSSYCLLASFCSQTPACPTTLPIGSVPVGNPLIRNPPIGNPPTGTVFIGTLPIGTPHRPPLRMKPPTFAQRAPPSRPPAHRPSDKSAHDPTHCLDKAASKHCQANAAGESELTEPPTKSRQSAGGKRP